MPIHHFALPVTDLVRSKEFYTKVLAPLGYTLYLEIPNITIGYSTADGNADFWISSAKPEENGQVSKIHLAFRGESHDQIKEWHAVSLNAGATDNGQPGYRPQYFKNYYAAFIYDPDGHNIEVAHGKPNK